MCNRVAKANLVLAKNVAICLSLLPIENNRKDLLGKSVCIVSK